MALETLTREVEHIITGRPGFEGRVFTESSPDYLVWPQAVKYTLDRGSDLQSAREAAVFRIEANSRKPEDRDHADSYQATRTAAVYFTRQGIAYVAFDDSVEGNLIVANAQEGYDQNCAGKELVMPMEDASLRAALARAEKADRVHPISQSHLELSLTETDGHSEFGSNEIIRDILGDVSEEYARLLKERGYQVGRLWTPSVDYIKKQVGKDKNALIRPVGLGVGFYFGNVNANVIFNINGFARGVRSQAPNFP